MLAQRLQSRADAGCGDHPQGKEGSTVRARRVLHKRPANGLFCCLDGKRHHSSVHSTCPRDPNSSRIRHSAAPARQSRRCGAGTRPPTRRGHAAHALRPLEREEDRPRARRRASPESRSQPDRMERQRVVRKARGGRARPRSPLPCGAPAGRNARSGRRSRPSSDGRRD